MRGVKEGWWPEIAPPTVPSRDIYGTCDDILQRTNETKEIIHTYPWIDRAYWRGPLVNQSDIIKSPHDDSNHIKPQHHFLSGFANQALLLVAAVLVVLGVRAFRARSEHSRKWQYTEIQT